MKYFGGIVMEKVKQMDSLKDIINIRYDMFKDKVAFLEKEDCATALVGHRAAIWFNSSLKNWEIVKLKKKGMHSS